MEKQQQVEGYKIIGSDAEGWTYLPRDYDDTFEAWAQDFNTRQEAVEAAQAEAMSGFSN